jgi:multicomponent Na+:H+ antiporter subunit A
MVAPATMMVAAFMFFAGHNRPGGGFAAGLIIGAVLALRALAGLARPRGAVQLMGVGGLIAAATAMAPIVVGRPLFDQVIVSATVPVLGKVKVGSALVFDVGVAFIVVGLVVAVLNGFAADRGGDRSAPRPDYKESVAT